MKRLLLLVVLIALPAGSRAEGGRRLFVKVHGKGQKIDSRALKPLAERQVQLVHDGTPQKHEPILLFVQQHDAQLVSEIKTLAKDHPVVVAAASPKSLDANRPGQMIQELHRAGARKVLFWDADRSPTAVHAALFGADAIPDAARSVNSNAPLNWGGSWVATPTSASWRGVLEAASAAIRERPRVIVLRGPRHGGKRDLLHAMNVRLFQDAYTSGHRVETEAQLLELYAVGDQGQVKINDNYLAHDLHLEMDVGRLSAAGQKKIAELIEGSAGTFLLSIDDGAKLDPILEKVLARTERVIQVPGLDEHREDVPALAQRFFEAHLGTNQHWQTFTRASVNVTRDPNAAPPSPPRIDPNALELLAQMDFPQGYRSLRAAMRATAERVGSRVLVETGGRTIAPPAELFFDDLSLGALMGGNEALLESEAVTP